MIQLIDATLADLGSNLLAASAQAGLLAVVLIGLRALIGRRIPAWWYAAGWTLVIARLAVPIELPNPVGLWSHLPAPTEHAVAADPHADNLTAPIEAQGTLLIHGDPMRPAPIAAINVDLFEHANDPNPTRTDAQNADASDQSQDVTFVASVLARDADAVWHERTQSQDDVGWATLSPAPAQVFATAPGDASDNAAQNAAVPVVAGIERTAQQPAYALMLAAVWLAGVLAVASVIAARHRALRAVLRDASPASRSVALNATACAGVLGLRSPVHVLVSDSVSSAFITGVRRPTIVLPQHLLSSLTREELRCVFIHELCHAKRADVLVGWVGAAAVAVHWFNPLAWLSIWLWSVDRERACDAASVRALGPRHTKQYGLTLIKAALNAAPRHGLTLAAAFGPERTSEMTRRIQLLPNSRGTATRTRIALAAGLVALATVTVTGAASPEDQRREAQQSLEQALEAVRAGEPVSTEDIARLAARLAELRELREDNAFAEVAEDARVELRGRVAPGDNQNATTSKTSITTIDNGVTIKLKGTREGDTTLWDVTHTTKEHGTVTMRIEQIGEHSFQVVESSTDDAELRTIVVRDVLDALPKTDAEPHTPRRPAGIIVPRRSQASPGDTQTIIRRGLGMPGIEVIERGSRVPDVRLLDRDVIIDETDEDTEENIFTWLDTPNATGRVYRFTPESLARFTGDMKELQGQFEFEIADDNFRVLEDLPRLVFDEDTTRVLELLPRFYLQKLEDGEDIQWSVLLNPDDDTAADIERKYQEAVRLAQGLAGEARVKALELREESLAMVRSLEQRAQAEAEAARGLAREAVDAGTREALNRQMIELQMQMQRLQEAMQKIERELESIDRDVEIEQEDVRDRRDVPARAPSRSQRPSA